MCTDCFLLSHCSSRQGWLAKSSGRAPGKGTLVSSCSDLGTLVLPAFTRSVIYAYYSINAEDGYHFQIVSHNLGRCSGSVVNNSWWIFGFKGGGENWLLSGVPSRLSLGNQTSWLLLLVVMWCTTNACLIVTDFTHFLSWICEHVVGSIRILF